MKRIDEIRKICRSLAKRGWLNLFLSHGLNLQARDIEAELDRRLHIDRTQPGFADFCPAGTRGVEPGDPALSLLYHALASPDVHPSTGGTGSAYPSSEELDAIENYIFSRKPFDSGELDGAVIGVFAFEYRPAASSAHGYHADFIFSRTGVARVGTKAAAWHGPWRRYRPDPPRTRGISVCPARYGAFVAKATSEDDTYLIPVVGRRDEQNDPVRTFYSPIHKLFPGRDCIKGADISLDFREYHRNEKLRKLHIVGNIEVPLGFDVNSHPFIRDSLNGGNVVRIEPCGASIMIMPRPGPTLVRTAVQINSTSGRKEPVRFIVPAATDDNRYSTSLQMSPPQNARLVPEYVNMRHRVRKRGPKFVLDDLNKLTRQKFKKMLDRGGFEAAHFVDDSADGCVTVSVQGLGRPPKSMPAYSIVAAPDFFPLADQLEISNWARRSFINFQEHFSQGAPWPLCEGRRAANIELPRPDHLAERAFERADETVTAIVGPQPRSRQYSAADRIKRFPSQMTDAASNEFDPGWDISMSGDDEGNYLAAYGLGSPFPEDAKLCAAINSFWPAAAPDASRTFANVYAPTAIPLLDEELGYHKRHPRVLQRSATTSTGWDGEQGPFLEKTGSRLYVNAADIDRSDYVVNSLKSTIDIRKTAAVAGNELVRRMDALRRSVRVLPPKGDWVSNTKLWLVSAEAIAAWQTESRRADNALSGSGYIFVFADFDETPRPTSELKRLRYAVRRCFECQISDQEVAFRIGNGRWKLASMQRLDVRRQEQQLMNKTTRQ